MTEKSKTVTLFPYFTNKQISQKENLSTTNSPPPPPKQKNPNKTLKQNEPKQT